VCGGVNRMNGGEDWGLSREESLPRMPVHFLVTMGLQSS